MAGRIYKTQHLSGDYEGLVQRGILRKCCCSHYQAKLRAERATNVIQGCIIMIGFIILICSAIAYKSVYITDSKDVTKLNQVDMKPTKSVWNIGIWKFITDMRKDIPNIPKSEKYVRDSNCTKTLNATIILDKIRKEVINQDNALQKLEYNMLRTDNFKAVALCGASGVGKSLTVEILSKVYPWPENVHIYSWSTIVPNEANKFSLLRNYIEQLSSCGQNLIIIDNLKSCDYNFVSIFNTLVQERIGGGGGSVKAAKLNVLIVYVFNFDMDNYWGQFELLQQLPADTNLINFRSFDEEELADCLCHILKLEDRVADDKAFADIMKSITVCQTGCKTVRREILSRTEVRLNSEQ